MVNKERSKDNQKPTLVPVIAKDEVRNRAAWVGGRQTVASLSRWRRFNRATIGFWLAGATSGIAGSIFGACMHYHHPAAIVISMIWWGIYLGCLGASIGALFGMFTTCNPRSGGTKAPVVPLSPDRGTLGRACGDRVEGPRPLHDGDRG